MRHAPRALLAGGLGLAASCLAACGGGAGLLSSDQANNFNAALDSISTAVQSGNCAAAANAADSLRNEVANLPPSINRTLTTVLNQGQATVAEKAAADCRSHAVTKTTTSSTTTTTTTDTTSSKPTSTTTTSSSSTTSTPPSTTSSTATSSTATTTSGSGTSSNGGSGGVGPGDGNGNGGSGPGSGGGNSP